VGRQISSAPAVPNTPFPPGDQLPSPIPYSLARVFLVCSFLLDPKHGGCVFSRMVSDGLNILSGLLQKKCVLQESSGGLRITSGVIYYFEGIDCRVVGRRLWFL
jgi:hypothetical protein